MALYRIATNPLNERVQSNPFKPIYEANAVSVAQTRRTRRFCGDK